MTDFPRNVQLSPRQWENCIRVDGFENRSIISPLTESELSLVQLWCYGWIQKRFRQEGCHPATLKHPINMVEELEGSDGRWVDTGCNVFQAGRKFFKFSQWTMWRRNSALKSSMNIAPFSTRRNNDKSWLTIHGWIEKYRAIIHTLQTLLLFIMAFLKFSYTL